MKNFIEFLEGADQTQVKSVGSTAGDRPVHTVVAEYAGAFETHRTVSDLVVGIHLDPVLLEVDVAGRRRKPRFYAAGDFDVSPPNSSYYALRTKPSRSMGVAISEAVVAEVLNEVSPSSSGDFGALHQYPQHSKLVLAVCQQLVMNVDAENVAGPLYTDVLVQTLILELYRASRDEPALENTEPGRLSRATVARIDDYIETHAMNKIDLRSMANIAGMPIARFTQALKRTTGKTPYQYALSSRLQKAQALVGASSLPLAQIAIECGFSSQSHMTDLFRKKIGRTPGALRRR